MKEFNSNKRPDEISKELMASNGSGSRKWLAAAVLIVFAVGGGTMIVSNKTSELSSRAPEASTQKSAIDGATNNAATAARESATNNSTDNVDGAKKLLDAALLSKRSGDLASAVISDSKKDSHKDLSSVTAAPELKTNLAGNYLLSKSNNPACGRAGSGMQVQLIQKGEPVLAMVNSTIRFIDINKGLIVEAANEGDKKAQSFEHTTAFEGENKLVSEETEKSFNQPVVHSTTSLELAGGILSYNFQQVAQNPEFGNTFGIHCEWQRR